MEFSGLTPEVIGKTLGQIGPAILAFIGGALILQFIVYHFFKRVLKSRYALPYALLSPAVGAMLMVVVDPFLFNVLLSFSDLRLATFSCYSPTSIRPCPEGFHQYGLDYAIKNFTHVFVQTDKTGAVTGWGSLLRTPNSTFPVLLGRTAIWTLANVVFHIAGGLGLALLLNQKIKLKGLYRTLIVIPWAMPQVIVALTWKTEFHAQYGFVNTLLIALGLQPVNWLSDPGWAFVAVLFVNIWLGIPFYMVTLLGGLQSISPDYYEAAQMDGAGLWQRFLHITIPLLRPIAVPAITLDVIWTFNQFNVIYLVTGGGPQESTNILVTALYNAAFGEAATQQYAFAAAFSLVIFLILILFVILWMKVSGGLREVYAA